jgi:hypothetical protein
MAGRNALTSPRDYVDNYDRRSAGLHPGVRGQMDPMMDTMQRSQLMRGAREPNPREDDVIADLMEMAAEAGWRPRGSDLTEEDLPEMIQAASKVASTDGDLALVERAGRSLGIDIYGPSGSNTQYGQHAPGHSPGGPDYVFGGQRPGVMHPRQLKP